MIKIKHTERGFAFCAFKDLYDISCSLQKSSLATVDAIWLGVDDPKPQIMDNEKGWTPYNIPKDVLLSTRMHLTRDQVAELLPILEHFVETGEIE